MSIFSFFGKKDQRQAASRRGSHAPASADRSLEGKAVGRTPVVVRDEQAARATARKIDAIESEMASEFIKPNPAVRPLAASRANDVPVSGGGTTREDLSTPTDWLIEDDAILTPVSGTAAAVEEAAILFASNQPELVEDILRDAIAAAGARDEAERVWRMLFDLYRVMGRQQAFEDLSIAYLSKFETSPPAWSVYAQMDESQEETAQPTVTFTGRLDSGSILLIERIRRMADQHQVLRLEFERITSVEPPGCALLLDALQKLHKSGHELRLSGVEQLADRIKGTLERGRRDHSGPSWLLLLELLRLLNREAEFEELGIDYCVTFEVSPPAFVAPGSKITAASPVVDVDDAVVRAPAVIEGNVEPLIAALAASLAKSDVVAVDCSALKRIEFHAASRLLNGIAPLCRQGKVLEFHEVNHLVAALAEVVGLAELVRIFPAKH